MFKGNVVRSDSLDPNYKVRFVFVTDQFELTNGEAIFTRQSPYPIVSFDDYTDYFIEKNGLDEETVRNLRLEIGKIVFDYIYSTREYR